MEERPADCDWLLAGWRSWRKPVCYQWHHVESPLRVYGKAFWNVMPAMRATCAGGWLSAESISRWSTSSKTCDMVAGRSTVDADSDELLNELRAIRKILLEEIRWFVCWPVDGFILKVRIFGFHLPVLISGRTVENTMPSGKQSLKSSMPNKKGISFETYSKFSDQGEDCAFAFASSWYRFFEIRWCTRYGYDQCVKAIGGYSTGKWKAEEVTGM